MLVCRVGQRITSLPHKAPSINGRRQMRTLSIEEMQAAAKLIEVDGNEAFKTVSARFGEDAAKLLLIAHLRRSRGSMDVYPPPPSIDRRVEEDLQRLGIS